MSATDTVLIFVGIPAAVVLIVAVLTMSGGRARRRYRPGRPFDFTPVWFLSAPEKQLAEPPSLSALASGTPASALPAGKVEIKDVPAAAGPTGGTSDRW